MLIPVYIFINKFVAENNVFKISHVMLYTTCFESIWAWDF